MVEAKDVFGNAGTAEVSFTHDKKPVLVVSSPESDAVARTTIPVSFTCSDDGPIPCSIQIQANRQVVATNEVSVLDLSDYDHSIVTLKFSARDSAGQVTSVERAVYVESNPRLVEEARVSGRIWDAQQDRILYLRSAEGGKTLNIRDRASGLDTVVLDDRLIELQYGFLTPQGAIFVASGTVNDWRDGRLVDLGPLNSSSSLSVNGTFAIWNVNFVFQDLILRDLLAGTNVIVSRNTGNWFNSVASNGDVVFWGNDYKVYRYRRGVTTLLSESKTLWNTYPITDGTNAVYRRHTGVQTYEIMMHGETGERILSEASPREVHGFLFHNLKLRCLSQVSPSSKWSATFSKMTGRGSLTVRRSSA